MTKILRYILLALAALLPLRAFPQSVGTSASAQVWQRFTKILRTGVHEHLAAELPKNGLPPGFTIDDLNRTAALASEEAEFGYKQFLTLRETEAEALLRAGPNDAANQAALKQNLEEFKTIGFHMPGLLGFLYEQFQAGKLQGSWELEFTRRVPDFHLRQARDAEKKKKD